MFQVIGTARRHPGILVDGLIPFDPDMLFFYGQVPVQLRRRRHDFCILLKPARRFLYDRKGFRQNGLQYLFDLLIPLLFKGIDLLVNDILSVDIAKGQRLRLGVQIRDLGVYRAEMIVDPRLELLRLRPQLVVAQGLDKPKNAG